MNIALRQPSLTLSMTTFLNVSVGETSRSRCTPVGETSRSRFLPLPAILHFPRITGACPPRSQHGEGQALALREGDRFFTAARGPRMPYAHPSGFHRDVERFMKHSQFTTHLVF